MQTEIALNLREAEETPDWDMRKLRVHLTVLERCLFEMSAEDHRRYAMQCERMRAQIRLRFGAAMGS